MKKNIRGKKCLICKSPCGIFQKKIFDDRYGAPGKYSIYKCINCGFGRLEPVLNYQKIGQFYAKYYPLDLITAEQVKKRVNIKPKWLAWLTGTNNTAHWLIQPNSTVLDIGSGSCVSLLEIKKIGGRAYGIEPDPNAQKIAQQLKLKVFKGFISDNPFPNKRFDFITSSQVIEHEPDPVNFLKSTAQYLNQNGKVILSFPNSDSLYRKIFNKTWINWHVPYHINHLTKRSLHYLAKQTGFRVVKLTTVTPNLWTVLQLAMFLSKTKEGEKSSIWSVNQNTDILVKNSVLFKYKIIFLKIVIIMIKIPVAVVNRIMDIFGEGDSFLAVLEKKYE